MASPAGNTPGRAPNGTVLPRKPPPPKRAPVGTNPLVQKKKPQRRPAPPGQRQAGSGAANGSAPIPSRPAGPQLLPGRDLSTMPFGDTEPSLFSKPPQTQYTDYPVYMSKRAILENLRVHVARIASRKPIDPRNPEQFVPPLYLLRRDVRAPMPGTPEWEELQAERRRREEENSGKVEQDAARAAAKAEVAPSLTKKKPKPQKKKANEARTMNNKAERIEMTQVKYEETMPWHLEDAEQKQIWMGTYEDASSNAWAGLKFEDGPQGTRVLMTPLEKWYKFGPKTRVDPEKIKAAEARRVKAENASPEPSFMKAFVDAEEKEVFRRQDEENALKGGGRGQFFRGKLTRKDNVDEDELDFEEDFADDEAPPAIEGEENDVKDIEKRIKKDHLKSNIFDQRALKDYEEEENEETREQRVMKQSGKKTMKMLFKRERNAVYEWDQENPYSEESDSTDTEAEAERERLKKEEEAKAAAAANASVKVKSEPGSRNNTPGSRASKHPEPLNRSAQNLKRPGSPGLSDVSGNESSVARKKAKYKGPMSKLASGVPSRTASPAPSANGSRRPIAASARSFGAGSGSDTEGGGPRKLTLSSPRSPNGSPGPSRMASRAGSPAPASSTSGKRPIPKNPEELRPYIPAAGIAMQNLVENFILYKGSRDQLVQMVKEIATYNKETKLLTPKLPQTAGRTVPKPEIKTEPKP